MNCFAAAPEANRSKNGARWRTHSRWLVQTARVDDDRRGEFCRSTVRWLACRSELLEFRFTK